MTENAKKQIKNLEISKENIKWNEPMKAYTTFKIGGPAECLIKIDNEKDLKSIVQLAKKENIDITILGNGSNVLIADEGIKGIVLMIQIDKLSIVQKDNQNIEVTVGAGYKIGKLAQQLWKNEIAGFEELAGIPGSIGGAIKMNSGAHGKEMKDIVKTVTCMDYEGNKKEFTNGELEFAYRKSILKTKKYITTEAILELHKGESKQIKEKMEQYMQYRKTCQPIEYPNAGSTFKRGNDYITAKLIDEAGLKGYTIGDAMVSEKHAGFVINKGNATAEDIIQLTEYIKKEIKEKFDKNLELEIEVIGK